MKKKACLSIVLVVALIVIIVVGIHDNESLNIQNEINTSKEFMLSTDRFLEDAHVEIEDIKIPLRDISVSISKIQSMQKKFEMPQDEFLKQIFLETLLEVEHAWQESQTVLTQPETKYGLVKTITMPETVHVVRPTGTVPLAVFIKDNIEYSYKKIEKDGRFLEVIRYSYLDNGRRELDKSKSYKLRFCYNDLNSIESYMTFDLGTIVQFYHDTNLFNSISKITNDKKYYLAWDKNGLLIAE